MTIDLIATYFIYAMLAAPFVGVVAIFVPMLLDSRSITLVGQNAGIGNSLEVSGIAHANTDANRPSM